MPLNRKSCPRWIGKLAILLLFASSVASSVASSAPTATASEPGIVQCGKASWYNLTGRTASGETADPTGLTAAHRTLPFGTEVQVTNLANGRTVTVRINDRGPFSTTRIIDVTEAAAHQLGFVQEGVTLVKLTANSADSQLISLENCQ